MREYDRFEKGAANSNTSTARAASGSSRTRARGSSSPRSRSSPRFVAAQQGPRDLRRACGDHLRRVPPLASSATCTPRSPRRSSATTCSASPAPRSSPRTPAPAATRSCAPPSRRSATSCTPTRSSMRSTTRTCCRSASTTSTRSRLPDGDRRQAGARRSTPSGRCSRRSGSARSSATSCEHFDQKTKRRQRYSLGGKRVSGFNSLFATASIDAAKRYYAEFAAQQEDLPPDQRLKIGLIYSYAANEAEADGLLGEEEFETDALDADARATSSTTRSGLQRHVRHQLRHLGRQVPELLQGPLAAAEEPRARPGDRRQHVPDRVRRHHAQHPVGRQEPARPRADPGVLAHQPHPQLGQDLRQHRHLPRPRAGRPTTRSRCSATRTPRASCCSSPTPTTTTSTPSKVAELLDRASRSAQPIVGEAAQKEFIALFGAILRLQNILTVVRRLRRQRDPHRPRECQDYQSLYLDLYAEFRRQRRRREGVDQRRRRLRDRADQAGRDQRRLHPDAGRAVPRRARATATTRRSAPTSSRAVDASPTLRNKKDLIEAVRRLAVRRRPRSTPQWRRSSTPSAPQELDQIIADEGLDAEETHAFVDTAFRDGAIQPTGTAITKILPPVSRFAEAGGHAVKKQTVLDKLDDVLRPVLRPQLILPIPVSGESPSACSCPDFFWRNF